MWVVCGAGQVTGNCWDAAFCTTFLYTKSSLFEIHAGACQGIKYEAVAGRLFAAMQSSMEPYLNQSTLMQTKRIRRAHPPTHPP
jgi:hypothetical protein